MYIKAIVKEIIDEEREKEECKESSIKIRLEGVEKFCLKCKEYENEIKFSKNTEYKDKNIFIIGDQGEGKDNTFELMNQDEKFDVYGISMCKLINNIFTSGNTAYMFKIEKDKDKYKYKVCSVRKCD